jgi:type VI protein secretion system component Hcp
MSSSQIFLDIKFEKAGTIHGECEFAGFENQIPLLEFGWAMQLKASQQRDSKQSVSLANVSIKKRFDDSSVKLMNCLNMRDTILKARITVAHTVHTSADAAGSMRKAFVLEMENARLESIDLGMTDAGDSVILEEDIVVCFTRVRIERYVVESDGNFSNKALVYTSQATDNLNMNESE